MGKLVKHLLAGCAAMALANVAHADRILGNLPTSVGNMTVTETVVPGTGDLAGFDIHRFFAAFSSGDLQGLAGAQGLQSAKVTLSTDAASGFNFLEAQITAPAFPTNPDVDVTGRTADDATYRTATTHGSADLFTGFGTGVFIHDPDFDSFSVQGLQVNGVGAPSTTAYDAQSPTVNGSKLYHGAKSFRVEGFVQNPTTPTPANPVGADPAAKTGNKGQIGAGSLFAVAIVPTGASVDASGIIAADKGPTTEFGNVPEPGTLGLLGLAATTLFARRRRNA